jgi:glutamate racemase
MNSDFIAIIDSGIGGISVLNELIFLMPNEKYLYFGDNQNAPYGNRTIRDLRALTFRNIDYIKGFGVKALVLGCNTLSTNLYNEISEYSGIPTFGVYPPIESVLIDSKRPLLLATKRTADCYKGVKGLTVVGLENLASDIERNLFNLNAVSIQKNLKLIKNTDFIDREGYYDTVVLGCTHYNFVKNEIFNHFKPQKMTSGNHFTAKAVQRYIESLKSSVNSKRFELLFVGDYAKTNKKFWVASGQKKQKN